MMMQIKESNDITCIYPILTKAFGQEEEARLVKDLLNDNSAQPTVSLVAEEDNSFIGHILFTKCSLLGQPSAPLMYILAPLAVEPEHQGKGVGAALIKEGLRYLKKMGVELVFVLGHMDYYPRLGFKPDAKSYGYEAPFEIPEKHKEAWMIQFLSSNLLPEFKGQVQCCDMLNKEEYWRE